MITTHAVIHYYFSLLNKHPPFSALIYRWFTCLWEDRRPAVQSRKHLRGKSARAGAVAACSAPKPRKVQAQRHRL